MPKKGKAFLFSYIPLLELDRSLVGEALNPESEIIRETLEESDESNTAAQACLWMDNEGTPAIILAYPEAEKIKNHLVVWAENKPETWFDLVIAEKGDIYAVALFPRLEKSVERWKIAFQLKTGYPPIDMEYSIFFRPLHFVSGSVNTYAQIKSEIKEDIKIGFADLSNIKPEEIPEKLDPKSIEMIGPFKVKKESNSYMDGLLENAEDPKKKRKA